MPTRARSLLLAAASGLWLLVSCAGGPNTGTLAVFVGGLPSGADASVRLVGASDVHDLVDSGSVELDPGSYAVEVGSVLGDEPLARTRYDGVASTSSVTVLAGGQTDLSVDYDAAPGSHRIWLSGESGPVAFEPADWSTTGTASPAVSLAVPAGWSITEDLAFSPDGDLYTTAWDGGILRYAAEDLDTDGASPAGSVTNADDAIGVVWHHGRLYVMNWNTQVVLRFDAPADIVGTDAVGPDAVMSVPGFTGEGLSGGLAFDDEGRLWIAFANGLVRIDDPEAPMGTVDVTPDAALTQTGPENRLTLAYFDGMLYTADCATSEVQRYDAVDAAVGTTARDPSSVFTVGQPCTADIAKDAAGRYWIASSGEVAGRYTDLATVGDGSVLSADVTVTHGEFPDGGGIVFRMTSLE